MGRKNETTFPAAPAAIAKPSRTPPPTTAAQVLIPSMTELEVWTCAAPLDHPLRRAFVAAQAVLYMEKVDPVPWDAKRRAETLRAMRVILELPGGVLLGFGKMFHEEAQREAGRDLNEIEEAGFYGGAFVRSCERWGDAVKEFAAEPLAHGRPRTFVPELLVELADLIRSSRLFTDDLRTKADRRVAEWAAEETKGRPATFLREIQRQRQKSLCGR